jgi:hypothetical protein
MNMQCMGDTKRRAARLAMALALCAAPAVAGPFFLPGNLVVSVSGNGVAGAASGLYTDNQASPLTLFQYQANGTASATYVNSLVLPQNVSGEYGSSSEGTLQLSGNGQYVTVMGYGVNAGVFNSNPAAYSLNSANTALAQSGSLTGQSYTPVPRVAVLIDANGNVDTTTALFNVFNGNNGRSAYTADGSAIYVSGQGTSGDNTGGVFLAQRGSASATSITGTDAGSGASQDTRTVQIVNGTLYVSSDSKSGATNRDYIGTLGTAGTPPVSIANGGSGPAMLSGFGNAGGTGKLTVSAGNTNGVNVVGSQVNLSPENYFFANASTLYMTDSGSPKNDSTGTGNNARGEGGLQKWVNSKADGSGVWTLQYTLSSGLGLVANTSASGTTGLYGLTGEVIGGQVELFANNFTILDLDQTYLYGITDTLSATTAGNEVFAQLAAAPVDSNFKGVSLAPTVPEPAAFVLAGLGLTALLVTRRRAPGSIPT